MAGLCLRLLRPRSFHGSCDSEVSGHRRFIPLTGAMPQRSNLAASSGRGADARQRSVAALGVVSLVVSERQTWSGSSLAPYIRLDVGLQPTAVGGAVVDARGKVLEIASPRFADSAPLLFPPPPSIALPKPYCKKAASRAGISAWHCSRCVSLNILRQSLQHKEKTAVIVLEVEPDGPAHKAGILIGDILVSLAGHPISRPENVQPHLQSENIGKSLSAKMFAEAPPVM